MADKIVQLINKDGDNIYPIASVPHGANITMTNVDPGEGAALEADHYIGVYGGDPMVLDYSISEVNTGTKWIDGSAIYKKTVDTGALPNTDTKNVAHGITNLNRVIKIEGYAYSSTATQTLPISYASADAYTNSVGAYVAGNDIVVRTGTDRTAYTESYITLYYTKSS